MRKMITGILLAVVLSVSIASPSQAYWKKQWGNVYWCNKYHQCY